jgi:hypothetical protein
MTLHDRLGLMSALNRYAKNKLVITVELLVVTLVIGFHFFGNKLPGEVVKNTAYCNQKGVTCLKFKGQVTGKCSENVDNSLTRPETIVVDHDKYVNLKGGSGTQYVAVGRYNFNCHDEPGYKVEVFAQKDSGLGYTILGSSDFYVKKL